MPRASSLGQLQAIKGSLEDGEDNSVDLEILSCDSIVQVKAKIIEALFPHRPFTRRPSVEDFVLRELPLPVPRTTLFMARPLAEWKRSTGTEHNAFYLPIETQLTSSTNRLPVIGDLNANDVLVGAHLVLVRLSQAGK